MNILKGKKTYIVAVGGIFTAIGGLLSGNMETAQSIQIIIEGLLAICLRIGIKNND